RDVNRPSVPEPPDADTVPQVTVPLHARVLDDPDRFHIEAPGRMAFDVDDVANADVSQDLEDGRGLFLIPPDACDALADEVAAHVPHAVVESTDAENHDSSSRHLPKEGLSAL